MQPKKLAVKLLLRQNICSIDTDLFRLDCRGHIIIDSVQHYAQSVHRDPRDFIGEGMAECVVFPRRGRHLILYNDWILSSARKRWSIAHEIGHICCCHTEDGPEQETQANDFAAELLMPQIVLREAISAGLISNAQDAASLFRVSRQAAQNQLRSVTSSHSFGDLDQQLLQKYIPLIKRKTTDPVVTIPYQRFCQGTMMIL